MEKKIKPEPLKTLKGAIGQTIVPFLWFDNNAEEAAHFYASVFKNARVKTTTRYSDESAMAAGIPKGSVMTVSFQIEGMDFTAINGGPVYKISPAISFMVNCRTREKIDGLWEKLSAGGKVMMEIGQYPFSERYGWVQDKYGVSWQLIMGTDHHIISPCLLFTGFRRGKAEEAMNYYMSVFRNTSVENIERYTEEDEGPTGTVKYGTFYLNCQNFKAMDSGIDVPFTFNPAVSFVVNCENQQEIDYYWENLSAGGDESARQCGWLADRYGVSWQVIPTDLPMWISDTDSGKGDRVMKALLQMKKPDMNVLQSAYEGTRISAPETNTDYGEIGANYEGAEHTYRRTETLAPGEEL